MEAIPEVAAVSIRQAAVILAVVAVRISRPLIFLQPVAAEHPISPPAPRLTSVAVVHISPLAYRTAHLSFIQRFTVLRVQQRTMR